METVELFFVFIIIGITGYLTIRKLGNFLEEQQNRTKNGSDKEKDGT
ncbi:MAG: hypothetical protein ACI4AD_06960 [Roseburia sp.]